VAGNGVELLAQTQQQWEKFDLMLDSHQLMIKEQVDVLKSQVASRVASFNNDVEKFAARWNQMKPKNDTLDADRPTVLKAVEFVKDKRAEFGELTSQAQKLV
jgi:dynein heavy chain 2